MKLTEGCLRALMTQLNHLRSSCQEVCRSSIAPWLACFLLLNTLVLEKGGDNARSRLATMRAMVEHGTFRIDPYVEDENTSWSMDWARTEDGHYYSNKPPGPMFLGLPVFFVLDKLHKHAYAFKVDERGQRSAPGPRVAMLLSVVTQAIPFMVLTFVVCRFLEMRRIPSPAIHFVALSLLFGNTAALFMNTYFGHSMAAFFMLATAFSLLRRKFFLVGLFWGFCLLCDYGAALVLLPLLVVLLWQNRRDWSWGRFFVIGALIPGVLWCWYHISCFGSPFLIAPIFNNPIFQHLEPMQGNIWGILAPLPEWRIVYELLLGAERGILVTQPWILVLIPLTVWVLIKGRSVTKEIPWLAFLSISGLVLLLWMNSCFIGGWHGGWSSGPRYLAFVFPLFALLAGFVYPHLTRPMKALMWGGLVVSLVLRGFVYSSTALAHPGKALWIELWRFMGTQSLGHNIYRVTIFVLSFSIGSYVVLKKERIDRVA